MRHLWKTQERSWCNAVVKELNAEMNVANIMACNSFRPAANALVKEVLRDGDEGDGNSNSMNSTNDGTNNGANSPDHSMLTMPFNSFDELDVLGLPPLPNVP